MSFCVGLGRVVPVAWEGLRWSQPTELDLDLDPTNQIQTNWSRSAGRQVPQVWVSEHGNQSFGRTFGQQFYRLFPNAGFTVRSDIREFQMKDRAQCSFRVLCMHTIGKQRRIVSSPVLTNSGLQSPWIRQKCMNCSGWDLETDDVFFLCGFRCLKGQLCSSRVFQRLK